jgi:diguanylate cyclase (GGDEF)-like protein
MTAPTPVSRIEELWDDHFRHPAAAYARAKAVLATGNLDDEASPWAKLTIGYHHLYFSAQPTEAHDVLAEARTEFAERGTRRGELLACAGLARLMIVEETPARARDWLLEIQPEAERDLKAQDRYWFALTLGAAYFFTDRLDAAIRCLYDAFEMLRAVAPSPQLPAVMGHLAAGLISVGDYEPARELARDALGLVKHFDSPQLQLSVRTTLAEALLACGDTAGAVAEVDTMFALNVAVHGTPPTNHYCAVAAETYAVHGRYDAARHCVVTARRIRDLFPGAFNESNYRWAAAAAAERAPSGTAIAALERAVTAAEAIRHVPTLCKAHERLAERYAALGRFEEAYRHQQRYTTAQMQRMANRVDVKYYLLKVKHELRHARVERDRAERQRRETEMLNAQLERLNGELQRKVGEIEGLQAQLAADAMQDPLTRLFNRRYLDAVMPGLIAGAARRGEPLALALVDLDYFKRVNDRYGHQAGDAVLVQIGELFAKALRPSDVFCRYGGEEFCVALPDTDGSGALSALAGLAARLHELEISYEGHVVKGLTFSAGVAVYPTDGRSFAALIASADRALYTAKGDGRNRANLASPAGRTRGLRRTNAA